MRIYDIISKKARGDRLENDEISYFVEGYTKGEIPDYQAAALLMAMFINGLCEEETVCLTECMARSGDMLDLSPLGENTADKHSTGGVGDKTTLIVAPVVAALGGTVAKMSGRGLGHTGGTIDKLESIAGYNTTLSGEEFFTLAEENGIAVVGQSGNLAPADKKIYALRDSTATVSSLPLIVSSIMSKKIAAGAKNIVLDVKTGSGAFMKTLEDSKALAEQMVKIGKRCGRNMAAVITNMDMPLGNAVGNALEVAEAVAVLRGEQQDDLYYVSVELASELVCLLKGVSKETAVSLVEDCIRSGKAYDKMLEWVASQGGDTACIMDTKLLPQAKYSLDLKGKSGYICSMDTEKIGVAATLLGAGRVKKEDTIDHAAGIIIRKKTGEYCEEGEPVCTLYSNDDGKLGAARDMYLSALSFGDKPEEKPLIYEIIR